MDLAVPEIYMVSSSWDLAGTYLFIFIYFVISNSSWYLAVPDRDLASWDLAVPGISMVVPEIWPFQRSGSSWDLAVPEIWYVVPEIWQFLRSGTVSEIWQFQLEIRQFLRSGSSWDLVRSLVPEIWQFLGSGIGYIVPDIWYSSWDLAVPEIWYV